MASQIDVYEPVLRALVDSFERQAKENEKLTTTATPASYMDGWLRGKATALATCAQTLRVIVGYKPVEPFKGASALRATMMSMADTPEEGERAFNTYVKLSAGEEVEGVEHVRLVPVSVAVDEENGEEYTRPSLYDQDQEDA